MAHNPNTLSDNTGRVTAPTTAYPYGSAKSDTTGTSGDGTPFSQALLNDLYGMWQWLLTKASITPSGNADTALVSQYGEALEKIIALNGSNIGQCVLVKDGTNLRLKPYNGNKIMINSKLETIPDAGVTVAPTSHPANDTRLIYAYMDGESLTLESLDANTAPHSTQTGTGVEIKTGDATRTLVGIARTNNSSAWEDSVGNRLVRSWFNPKPVELKTELNATVTTTSTSWIELNSNERVNFVCWEDETVYALSSGRMGNSSSAGRLVSINIGLDGASTLLGEGSTGGYGAGYMDVPASSSGVKTVSEGHHYITLLGCANVDGTAVFHADGANETDATGLTGVLVG